MQVDIAEYLENIIREKQLKRSQIVKDSGLDRSYVYHILNGERKNPSRSKLLAICVAMKMDIKETLYFLRAAQVPVLYPRTSVTALFCTDWSRGRVLWNSMKRYIRCSLNCWNRIHGK